MRGTRFARARSVAARAASMAAAALLAGCGIGASAVADPAIAGMGCEQSDTFLFSGETSLRAIGLGDEFAGPEAGRVGMIWVTAEPVDPWGPGPPPPGPAPEMQRMVCVQWPDGSGMSTTLPPGWEPPGELDLDAVAGASEPPLVLIGLLAAVALVGAVSYLAFRGERS